MELDYDQLQAVTCEAKNIFCRAAASAGKTRVLVERIRWLVGEKECYASRIVCFTFTNAAAQVLQERLGFTIGFCGTIHSYMLRQLQQYGHLIGFASNQLAVMDDDQSEALLGQIIKDLRLKTTVAKVRKTQQTHEKFPETRNRVGVKHLDSEMTAVLEYEHRMRINGVIDFDSILNFGLELLLHRMMIGQAAELHALFCDEIQDSGNSDLLLFNTIPARWKFCVGDFSQSIYSFRGANLEAVMLHAANSQVTTLELPRNYRSDGAIIDVANSLMARVPGCSPTQAVSQERGEVRFELDYADPPAQWAAIAQQIKAGQHLYLADDCAVLLRTNSLVRQCADALEGHGVQVRRRTQDVQPEDWPRCRLLLNLLINPENDWLAYQWLRQTRGEAEANRLKLAALSAFQTLNQHVLKVDPDIPVAALPEALLRAGIGRESIARVGRGIDLLDDGDTLTDLSAILAQEVRSEEGQGVFVGTVHSAKGAEHFVCYVPCLNEGIFPMANEDVEESRRILYVAATRAQHKLVLMAGKTISQMDFKKQREILVSAEPSRFLKELMR